MKLFLLISCFFSASFSFGQNVGIGNPAPSEKLEVTGNIKADSVKANVLKMAPNAGAGKVLLSDAAGNAGWQSAGNLVKAYNGLSKSNDTINLGGTLYNNTDIKLAQHRFNLDDIGSSLQQVAVSGPAASNAPLSATPITQTFIPSISCVLTQVQINITALSGGVISVSLKNDLGVVLGSVTKSYGSLTNGLDIFGINSIYLDNTKTYTISIAGSNSFINYDPSSNAYPAGTSSLGANADIGFIVSGYAEEILATFANNKVGIGTVAPIERLEVNGNVKGINLIATNSFQLSSGSAAGKILTSDALGNGTWGASNAVPGTIALSGNLYGLVTSSIPVTIVNEFFGPTTTVTLNGHQRLVMNIVATLGRSAAGNTSFILDGGFQLQPAGAITFVAGINYMFQIANFTALTRNPYPMTGSIVLPAGTYKIGPVINCGTTSFFNNNDYVNGTYSIINE